MSAGALTVRVDGNLLLWRGWKVAARLREAGCKPIYSTVHGAYMVDAYRLGDILAYLDSRNIGVEVIDDGEPDDGGDAA